MRIRDVKAILFVFSNLAFCGASSPNPAYHFAGQGARSLGEYFPDDPGLLDACEPLIKALEPERQPAVVDAEAV